MLSNGVVYLSRTGGSKDGDWFYRGPLPSGQYHQLGDIMRYSLGSNNGSAGAASGADFTSVARAWVGLAEDGRRRQSSRTIYCSCYPCLIAVHMTYYITTPFIFHTE
jgi:hypothetical protein